MARRGDPSYRRFYFVSARLFAPRFRSRTRPFHMRSYAFYLHYSFIFYLSHFVPNARYLFRLAGTFAYLIASQFARESATWSINANLRATVGCVYKTYFVSKPFRVRNSCSLFVLGIGFLLSIILKGNKRWIFGTSLMMFLDRWMVVFINFI